MIARLVRRACSTIPSTLHKITEAKTLTEIQALLPDIRVEQIPQAVTTLSIIDSNLFHDLVRTSEYEAFIAKTNVNDLTKTELLDFVKLIYKQKRYTMLHYK
jgi:glycosylphosphatidylinositol transamidase (GPIT) subunit GPI8